MALATFSVLMDLDGSGAYATDITGYIYKDSGFDIIGRGRTEELDAAGPASLTLQLDNSDGRFTPGNAAGAYFDSFHPYDALIKAQITYNAVTYDQFEGVVTDISVRPGIDDQIAYLTALDSMFVLSRTEIRRPLMLNQYTGVIISRLLDDVEGAEGREACTNPAFATDLTGWTVGTGAGVLTRMTGDDKILEGPAALRMAGSAFVGDMARYTFPTSKAGLTLQCTAYVKPERDADIAATVNIRMQDNVGVVATGVATAMGRDKWVRLSISGTYNGGSTSQSFDVFNGASAVQFRVGAAHAVPFVNAMVRAVDDGQCRLEKYAYNRGPALQAVQEVRENELLGALFYFDGAGAAVFEDKHHRTVATRSLTSQATPDELRLVLDYQESGGDRIKEVVLDYPHWVDGVAGTEMFSLDRVISIAVGKTERVEVDYGGGLARNTITPIANTHYTITFAADGAGGDATGSVAFTFQDFGGASVGTFVNNHASKMVYLRTYKVLATPARLASDRTPARYTPAGGPALAATLSHDYQYNGSEPAMQSAAEYLGDRYSTQRARVGLQLSAPQAAPAVAVDAIMTAILSARISDRWTITNNNLAFSTMLNAPFYIEALDLKYPGHSIEATLRLTGVEATYFNAGDTIVGGEMLRP